ncbi:MAG: hypothetical protein JWL88_203 [Parcubacteria group bacterium]|nr:hypothetical protein [Parcubacteria group bacterium]
MRQLRWRIFLFMHTYGVVTCRVDSILSSA